MSKQLVLFNIDSDCESILKGLGFSPEDFTRLTDDFSGGWGMRIEVAKILLWHINLPMHRHLHPPL